MPLRLRATVSRRACVHADVCRSARDNALDLHDDYWDKQGRKSIDAVIVFAGLLTMTYAAQDALDELGLIPRLLKRPS